MRLALISDIHANLPALEGVLRDIRKHAPDSVISLGDQVNLGPCPRETLALLKAENVACLHGNHERYILSAMASDPAYAGANFNALRFNGTLLSPEEITFTKDMRFGHVLLTHALPGDDRFPVFHVKQCTEKLRQMDTAKPLHIFCGHGHNPKQYRVGNLTLNVVGSVGCMDDGVPGCAPYTIVDIEGDRVVAEPYYAQYDFTLLPDLYRASGMVEFCPIMAHIACRETMDNKEYLVAFASRANALAKEKGEACVSEETWAEIDRTFAWPDGLDTKAFWRK